MDTDYTYEGRVIELQIISNNYVKLSTESGSF